MKSSFFSLIYPPFWAPLGLCLLLAAAAPLAAQNAAESSPAPATEANTDAPSTPSTAPTPPAPPAPPAPPVAPTVLSATAVGEPPATSETPAAPPQQPPPPAEAVALMDAAMAAAQSALPDPVLRPVAFSQTGAPAPAAPGTAAARVELRSEGAEGSGGGAPAPARGELRLNFQNASLTDVLNYLSEAAGLIVLQDGQVNGTVNVISRQPVSVEDAIEMLNAILLNKGYAAIRNGRILKIVPRASAPQQDIPVMAGSDPAQIPKKDGIVTQILPVKYVDAMKLVENLRPLLAPDASISANEASNAILLADTQTNIHRMAEIIHALDNSISSISALHVYTLQYADAKSLAAVITQLFASSDQGAGANRGPGGRGMPPWVANMMAGQAGANGQSGSANKSAAQQAALRVIAVADEPSNSVVVSAPDAVLPSITDIVNQLDMNITGVTEVRVFELQHADATELANQINALYSDSSVPMNTSAPGNANTGMRRPQQQPQQPGGNSLSDRLQQQTRVVAVSDPRTNAVIVSAAKDAMPQIALMVGRLDSTDDKKQQVFVHRLENADPDNVATILRGMFSSQGATNSTSAQPTSGQINARSRNGASTNVTNLLSR